MPRPKSEVKLSADELNLVTYGITETTSGVILYVKKKGRNVHLQMYSRDGRMNAHITDTAKTPERVWEMDVRIEDMAKNLNKAFKKADRRYNWNEKYCVFDAEFLKALNLPTSLNGQIPPESNLLDMFRCALIMNRDRLITQRISIRDGLRSGPVIGYQFSKTQTYVVVPIDQHRCFKMNLDWRRNYMRYVPFLVGLHKYEDYIERENLIDWNTLIANPLIRERIQKIEQELMPNQ